MRSWLRSRFGDVKSAKNGKEMRVCCPFCRARVGRADTKYHLYVSAIKHVAHCFRCNWAGNWVGLIMSVDGCSYGEALTNIRQPRLDVNDYDDIEKELRPHSPRGLVQANDIISAPEGYSPLTYKHNENSPEYRVEEQAVWRYLECKRNVPRELIMSVFGWIPGTQRAWCLVDDGWWQGRLIVPGEPKYLSPPWPKGDSLWNAQALDRYDHVIVCEGIFSAIAMGKTAVALCGKTINDEQAARIANAAPSQLTVLLDADATSDIGAVVGKLLYVGYSGELYAQYMQEGDPADGVLGKRVEWSFEAEVATLMGMGPI